MPDILETDVTIVGGGISGLATAYYLNARGIEVQIVEKSDRAGGTIETTQKGGFLIDCGPNSALDTTPLLGKMFDDLGIAGSRRDARDKAKNRFIVKDGRLCALPMSPPAFLRSPLFSRAAKLRLLREPFVRPSEPDLDESLADFVERRLGREMLDYAINPFVSGVYAGAPESLSVRAAFPRLHELEQQYGSLIKGAVKGRRERKQRAKKGEASKQAARLFSFAGGMQTIVNALAEARNEAVHTGTSIVSVRRADYGYEVDAATPTGDKTIRSRSLVFAIPAHAFDHVSIEFDFPVGSALAAIPYPPVSMVFFGYRDVPTEDPLDGFGFLVPEKENRNILGTIWSSTLFSGRAPEGGTALTTFVGGSRQPELALLPEGELVGAVQADLKKLVGVRRDPDVIYVRVWERAIPQYNVGHLDFIREVEAFESRMPGLYISGNFRGGVSVSDCVKQAHVMGARVSEALLAQRQ